MRREAVGLEVPEITVTPRPPHVDERPPKDGRTAWLMGGAILFILVVGLQLIPSGEPASTATSLASLPEPAAVTTSTTISSGPPTAFELEGQFEWIEVGGLDRFESVTSPIAFGDGFVTVGNPPGVSSGASVLVSEDGSQWNRRGTIHGVGGEVEIVDLEHFAGFYLALGTYTETMPVSDAEPRHRLPAVWRSDDLIDWEMTSLDVNRGQVFTPQTVVTGAGVGLVTGWTDRDYGDVARYQALPEPYRQAVARGDLFLQSGPGDQVEVVAPGGILVFTATVELEAQVAPGWAQTFYRTDDAATWAKVAGPGMEDDFTIVAGPSGKLVAARQGFRARISTDGLKWFERDDLYLPGMLVAGPEETLLSLSWDSPILRIWSVTGSRAVRLNPLATVPYSLQGIAANHETMAILRVGPDEVIDHAPAPTWVQVGEYLVGIDLAARIPGTYDPDSRTVTIVTEAGWQVVMALDGLQTMWEGQPPEVLPDHSLLVSIDGITWVSDQVPIEGYVAITGGLGDGFLLRATTPAPGDRWPGSVHDLLALP